VACLGYVANQATEGCRRLVTGVSAAIEAENKSLSIPWLGDALAIQT